VFAKLKSSLLWGHSLALLLVALLVGWFAHSYYDARFRHDANEVVQLRESSGDYRFIRPLILVKDTRDLNYKRYDNLREDADDLIALSIKKGKADRVSLYFRDLDGGEWVGVNEEDKFAPASMLKVSTLMVFLKLADKDPKVFLEYASYEPTDIIGQFYKPHQLAAGQYTVKELLQQMIKESDNDAMRALHKLHVEELVKIYKDLDLPDPFSDLTETDFMSPREYSRFFRTFYNGSYISHFYSDEALGLLALTNFKDGLVAGVPGGTVVSHKFGEYTDDKVRTRKELHDCGIVYYPEKPYYICVMTEGKDLESLAEVIKGISKIIYENINQK
jgi:beta-lactamase class A